MSEEANAALENESEVTTEETKVIEEEQKSISIEEYNKLLATNNRLLDESKAHKKSRQRAEDAKKIAEGKKDEVIESLRGRISNFEAQEEDSQVAQALDAEAKKRGCPDWDLMFNAVSNEVKYDRESGQVSGVTSFFDSCEADDRLNRKFFLKESTVKTDNVTPSVAGDNGSFKRGSIEYLSDLKSKDYTKYTQELGRMTRDGQLG